MHGTQGTVGFTSQDADGLTHLVLLAGRLATTTTTTTTTTLLDESGGGLTYSLAAWHLSFPPDLLLTAPRTY